MRRAHLPIVEPCAEDWSAMTGDERRRHCSRCDREVVHLSAMTVGEARQALAARPGERVCVRYSCDADDNIVFAPRARAALLATALAACTAGEAVDESPRVPEVVQLESQACEEEPAIVDEESGQCEGEWPEVIELPGGVVDIEVPSVRRRDTATSLVLGHTTMGIPLAREDARYLELFEPEEPRGVVQGGGRLGGAPATVPRGDGAGVTGDATRSGRP